LQPDGIVLHALDFQIDGLDHLFDDRSADDRYLRLAFGMRRTAAMMTMSFFMAVYDKQWNQQ
jgi:hypothetical protein